MLSRQKPSGICFRCMRENYFIMMFIEKIPAWIVRAGIFLLSGKDNPFAVEHSRERIYTYSRI